ncbi:MAG: hypothetical protein PHF84_12900, partial [bacterium]|nr:hypothetical protein [bacterium]
MKKIKILLIIFFLCTPALSGQMLFHLGIEEGTFFTAGNIYFLNNLSTDLAYIQSLNRSIALIGYYQLKYTGPGIGDSAETKFSERAQNHYFMLKPIVKAGRDLTIKPSISFYKEFDKFGKNEEWGEGLYDYNTYE